MKHLLNCELVDRFARAERHLLQVLLSDFILRRHAAGACLQVIFDEDTPAVWLREGKARVREWMEKMPDHAAKVLRYQADLDQFLIEGVGEHYPFNDPDFVFRHVSGGTLPVVRWGKRDYYALFYRDVFPIGWNLSNGGGDTRDELLRPIETIERELREELFVVDTEKRTWYVFADEAGKTLERSEHTAARRLWEKKLREETSLTVEQFTELIIPLKWMPGPDRLEARFGKGDWHITSNCFVTITAEDFGIEIDKVAKMTVDERAILLDGEVYGDRLLNRPVGLFEVDALHHAVARGERSFVPDHFFHGFRAHHGDWEKYLRRELLQDIRSFRNRREIEEFIQSEFPSDLCPVAKRMVQRQVRQIKADETRSGAPPGDGETEYEVFISHGGGDEAIASLVFRFVMERLGRKAFFYTDGTHHSHFRREIETALETSRCFISVSSSSANLRREWPMYECQVFHNEMLNGNKPQSAQIISFITGFDPRALPLPQRLFQAIVFDRSSPGAGLETLSKYLLPRT